MSAAKQLSSDDPSPRSREYTQRLFGLMKRRLELLQGIQQLGALQNRSVDKRDAAAMLKVLSQKQQLISELDWVRQQLLPYHKDDPEQRNWSSAEEREQCRQIAEQGTKLTRILIAADESALREFTLQRDAVASQLRDGTDSVLARTAYAAENVLAQGELDIGGV